MARSYTTIPVTVEVKEMLDRLRKGRDWSTFLRELVEENIRLRRALAARRLQARFNEVIERAVVESKESLRRGLRLREIV